MKGLFKKLIKIIWPQRCGSCHDIIDPNSFLCDSCTDELCFTEAPICKFCGRGKDRCCCRRHKREYERVIARFYYEKSAGNIIRNLKFRNMAGNAAFIAEQLVIYIHEEYDIIFDLIASVPMSLKDKTKRGYNQAELIGKELSKQLQIKYDEKALYKVQENRTQHKLSAKERTGNVFGVYEADPASVNGKTILLVDDIVTTGATLNECAKMLRLAGAEQVFCVAGAITTYSTCKV